VRSWVGIAALITSKPVATGAWQSKLMNIALLEDDTAQADLMAHWLTGAGLRCLRFETGAAFRVGILQEHADLILIDWTLPDDDGLAILNWLRSTLQVTVPIMFVTGRAEEESLVLALQQGADDYLIKPLRQAETLARVNALLRRGGARRAAVVTLGCIQVDIDNHRAIVNGTAIDLTEREAKTAALLLRNHGRLITREQLLEDVWKTSTEIDKRAIDTHLSRLRIKLGLTPANGFNLLTVFHKGYRLEMLPPPDQDRSGG